MRILKLLLMLSVIFIALSSRADATAASENTEAQKKENRERRAERPLREAVKLTPSLRESAPRPDDSGKMKRIAPPRAESPLQDVPALMDPPPGAKSPANP